MTIQLPILCLVVIALLQSLTVADVKTEENGSSPESRPPLRILVQQMDTNRDGQVTDMELAVWIEKLLKALDVEEAVEWFEETDKNRDGFITWDEYRLNKDKEPLEEYFEAADVDQDGKLSRDEVYNPESYDHVFGALVQASREATLAEKDKNNDGKVWLEEFVGDQAQAGLGGAEADLIQHERERFQTYDVDHDGFLTGEELRRWLVTDFRKTAQKETQRLMGNADKNKDGTLSIDEIVDEYDLFVRFLNRLRSERVY